MRHTERHSGKNELANDCLPEITVVICTHNRAEYLSKAIVSVIDQGGRPGRFEIVVVDNASEDRTREVVKEYENTGLIRYVYEQRRGISYARNTGWRNARAPYVAYLDDDAIASAGWIDSIGEAFRFAPDAAVVGGRVDPIWEAPRPAWLSDEIAVSLALIDWGEVPKVIEDLRFEWLVTANMAAKVTALEEIGGFSTRLGRVGRSEVRGEDTFLQRRLMQRGKTCVYYPDMAVRHLVPASRLNKEWFWHRYFTQGIADAIVEIIEESPGAIRRLSRAAAKSASLLASPGDMLSLLIPSNDPKRFTRRCFALIVLGHVATLLGVLRRKN